MLAIAFFTLLALNGFFVLAEFAIVKVRPSRVTELADLGTPGARNLQKILDHLDEYLSVCQVGITFASVALGMVGQLAVGRILGDDTTPSTLRLVMATGFSYVVVSGSHIVLSELVPKSIAIRIADRMALRSAAPLRFFKILFYPILTGLNAVANGILRLIGFGPAAHVDHHSEDELRIILDQSQERGLMSFRRLLFIENIFDFGELIVRDAMRPRAQVRCLDAGASWETNLAVVRAARFSRYPLIVDNPDRPAGIVHLKDLVIAARAGEPDLQQVLRPLLTVRDDKPLEDLLSSMQRRHIHAGLVTDKDGRWIGFVTLEDVVEELIGTIRDEFEDEEQARLETALKPERVFLDLEATSPMDAVRNVIESLPASALPVPAKQVLDTLIARERVVSTYLGSGIGVPHARLSGLERPLMFVLRPRNGVAYEGKTELCRLLFVLLTPAGQPRVHQQLLSRIATLLHESDYVKERLLTASTREEVVEVIRTGEQAALD